MGRFFLVALFVRGSREFFWGGVEIITHKNTKTKTRTHTHTHTQAHTHTTLSNCVWNVDVLGV